MIKLKEKRKADPNRFVPAPYEAPGCAGWAPEAPEADRDTETINAQNGNASSVAVSDGAVCFNIAGETVKLTDSIHSGWLHAASGGNLNEMFNVIDGDFDFFKKDSKLSRPLDDGAVTVVRISTSLRDRESGVSLNNAVVHTDLYFWKAVQAVTVMTMFETFEYTPVREIYQCRASSRGRLFMSPDGGFTELSEEEHFSGGLMICRDLSEFNAQRPFITHISAEKGGFPEIVHEKRTWEGPVTESGDMVIRLVRTESGKGLAIGSIEDKKGIANYDGAQPEPLFRMLIRYLDTGREEMLSSVGGWDKVTEDISAERSVFLFEKEDVSVTVTGAAEPDKSLVGWEINASVRNGNITVIRLDPPAARMNAAPGMKLFMTFGPGMDVPIWDKSEIHSMSPYPSIGMCMEYLAIYNDVEKRGVYCGFHDPEGSYKFLLGDVHCGVCRAEAMIPAEGMDEPANGFAMKGRVVWRIFDGDWYDATLIFREFVRRYARWFTGIPAEKRDDVPEWLLKMPVWLRCDVDENGDFMEELLRVRSDFEEMPAGLHVYCWHKIPFDTNYPHYFPEKDVFRDSVETLQAHNVKVMPYINGRLWDTHDRGDEDYQFSSVARPGAAKGRSGEVITEHYGSKNSKGEDVELAVMCPSSAIWQEKQAEINDRILNGLKCDAVYIDQIAAAPPVTCMDRTHSHRSGGGSWWYDCYRNLIEHLKLKAGDANAFTTESNAEPFTGHIGGMLVWHWVNAHQVPAYSVVYAGFQPIFGRNYGICRDDPTGISFRILTAESLCFGDQPGWITPDVYLCSKYRDLFKAVAKLRFKYGEFFYAGECLRPPRLEGDAGRLTGAGFDSPGVRSGMWRRNSDGRRIVTLVNVTEEKREVTAFPEGADAVKLVMEPVSAAVIEL